MSDFTVTKAAMRPASTARCCFHCHRNIGDVHSSDCVLIKKKVKVSVTIEYEVDVPNDWDKQQIEFHRNESSWCKGNLVYELQELNEKDEGCLCGIATFKCLDDKGEPFLNEK